MDARYPERYSWTMDARRGTVGRWRGAAAGVALFALTACGGSTSDDARGPGGAAGTGGAGGTGGTATTGGAPGGGGQAGSGGSAGLPDPGGCGTKTYFSNAWSLEELPLSGLPPLGPAVPRVEGNDQAGVFAVNGAEASLWKHGVDHQWTREDMGLPGFAPRDLALGANSGRWLTSMGGAIAEGGLGAGGWGPMGGVSVPSGSAWVWDPTAFDYPHLFVVGDGGEIARYEGGAWNIDNATSADLQDVSGSSYDDVFAVGSGGTILHYGSHSPGGSPDWKSVPNPSQQNLHAVWALGAGHAIAVGDDSTVLDVTPDGAQSLPTPASVGMSFTGVWASGPEDVFVTGGIALEHWDGTSWLTLMQLESTLQSIWGSSSRDVYLLMNKSQIMHCSLPSASQ
jgi:hypothetical protein